MAASSLKPTFQPALFLRARPVTLTRRWLITLWIAVPIIYIGLPVLILLGAIPWDMKFVALTVAGAVVYALFRLAGYTNAEIGATAHGAGKSLLRVAPLTVLLVVAAVVLYAIGYSRIDPSEDWLFYLFYIFISCPVQEFLYRGALSAFGRTLKLPTWAILLMTSLLYAYVHVIYLDWLTVAVTFLIGLYWFWVYNGARTLIGVSVSHAILGVATIAAGLID